jgi:hypothetical protein
MVSRDSEVHVTVCKLPEVITSVETRNAVNYVEVKFTIEQPMRKPGGGRL